MWPRSQWLQISTWTRQPWHKNNRAGVPPACSWQSPPACAAAGWCRGRNPSRVRWCPCIRAPARCRARRRCKLPRWDRCRACLQYRQVLIVTADRLSEAARPRTGKKESRTLCGTATGMAARQSRSDVKTGTRICGQRPIKVRIAATPMIARYAHSPSSPAPSARRCAASGLDRSARPSK